MAEWKSQLTAILASVLFETRAERMLVTSPGLKAQNAEKR